MQPNQRGPQNPLGARNVLQGAWPGLSGGAGQPVQDLTFGSLLGKIFQLQLYRLLLAEQRQILANHDHNTRENLEALSLKLNTPILEFCCRPHL